MLVELDIDSELKINFYPIVNDDEHIELAKGDEKAKILKEFNERSKSLLNGEWINGWRSFCESVKYGYEKVLIDLGSQENKENKFQAFAHYLDCEAHRDVWQELFPTWNLENK